MAKKKKTGEAVNRAGLTGKQAAFITAYCGKAWWCATEAARQAGYAGSNEVLRAVGYENLTKPHIQAAIQARREEIKREGIAVSEARIARLSESWSALRQVVKARSEELDGECPGGETGLLVRQERAIGSGESTRFITEYNVDTGLLRELRELEKQAAQEIGDWKQPGSADDPFHVQHTHILTAEEVALAGLRKLVELVESQTESSGAG